MLFVDKGGGGFVFDDGGKEIGFDVGGFVDVWWYVVGD